MSVIRLPIDVKSLFFNIKNDNKTGHTATVATPLKQGASVREELSRITEIPENINTFSREELISKILAKSRAQAKIVGLFVFDKFSVNGVPLDEDNSFCMYIREETDPGNVHFGRQKIHYPSSLVFEDNYVTINNKSIMKSVSAFLRGYAFLIEAFEYDTETGMLNFDATVVGENDIPYSKVFINRRGVGNKFTSHFTEISDIYDMEIIALREKHGYDVVTPENFNEIISANTAIAHSLAIDYLTSTGAENIRVLKEEYPYALYDIQYTENGVRKYAIVKQTATKSKYFSLPLSKIQFCNDFSNQALLLLVTDVNGTPQIYRYMIDDLNRLNKSINSITYEDRN